MFSKKKRQILLGLALSLAVLAAPVVNADDIYMQIDGIEGESVRKDLPGATNVSSWNWAMNWTSAEEMAVTRSRGAPQIRALRFSHYIDKTSPKLMDYLLTGREILKARLVVFKSGTLGSAPYLTIELERVRVSSISTGGGTGSDQRAMEDVELTFSEVIFKYFETDDKSGTMKGTVEARWNLATNSKT